MFDRNPYCQTVRCTGDQGADGFGNQRTAKGVSDTSAGRILSRRDGIDLQLIEDGTYFCVEEDGSLVGCGGWSRRATLYGGNHSAGRDPRLLDPATERARIRAMYTHPEHTRKGIGRLILDTAEAAARAEGFSAIEMAATMSGKPLYLACGYEIESEWFDENGAVPVPLATMWKQLD